MHKFTLNLPSRRQTFTTLWSFKLFWPFFPFSQHRQFSNVHNQRGIPSDLSTNRHFVCHVFSHQRTFFSSVPWRLSHHSCLFLLAELFVLFPTRSSSSHISSSFSSWQNRDSLAVGSSPLLGFEGRGEEIRCDHFVLASVPPWVRSISEGERWPLRGEIIWFHHQPKTPVFGSALHTLACTKFILKNVKIHRKCRMHKYVT